MSQMIFVHLISPHLQESISGWQRTDWRELELNGTLKEVKDEYADLEIKKEKVDLMLYLDHKVYFSYTFNRTKDLLSERAT